MFAHIVRVIILNLGGRVLLDQLRTHTQSWNMCILVELAIRHSASLILNLVILNKEELYGWIINVLGVAVR
jgi:hypothetical protein